MPEREAVLNRERLRELMKERKMRQSQLALYTGLSTAAISRIFTGQRRVGSLKTISKIADVLNVPISELIAYEELPVSEVPDPEEERKAREEEIGRKILKILTENPELIAGLAEIDPDLRSDSILKILQEAQARIKGNQAESALEEAPPRPQKRRKIS